MLATLRRGHVVSGRDHRWGAVGSVDPSDAGLRDLVRRAVGKLLIGPIKYRSPAGYDAKRFWADRLGRYGGALRGVGHEGLSEEENQRTYQEAGRVLLGAVSAAGVDIARARVLDIGCGPGYFTQLLADAGAGSYMGVDITDVLFPDLRARFPGFGFTQADITTDRLEGRYDVVLMIDVAEHIMTTHSLDAAIENARGVTAPGGIMLIGPSMRRGGRRLFYVHLWSSDDVRQRFPGYVEAEPVRFRNGHLQCFKLPSASEDT
jgi:SAM-dependent methyltransferase